MIHFFLALPILVVFLDLVHGAADGRRAALFSARRRWCSSSSRSRSRCILSALTVHFRDIRDILSNLLTLWFFATPIIYPYLDDAGSSRRQSSVLNLNPFTHLAISVPGDPVLRTARSATGSGCVALGVGSVGVLSRSATACSIACATRSPRKCELDDGASRRTVPIERPRASAIEVTRVSKIYRRYSQRKQFATLKSALLSRQPDQEPAARRDVHGAERRQPDGAEGSHARRHRPQRIRQEHAAEARRRHHQAVRAAR